MPKRTPSFTDSDTQYSNKKGTECGEFFSCRGPGFYCATPSCASIKLGIADLELNTDGGLVCTIAADFPQGGAFLGRFFDGNDSLFIEVWWYGTGKASTFRTACPTNGTIVHLIIDSVYIFIDASLVLETTSYITVLSYVVPFAEIKIGSLSRNILLNAVSRLDRWPGPSGCVAVRMVCDIVAEIPDEFVRLGRFVDSSDSLKIILWVVEHVAANTYAVQRDYHANMAT